MRGDGVCSIGLETNYQLMRCNVIAACPHSYHDVVASWKVQSTKIGVKQLGFLFNNRKWSLIAHINVIMKHFILHQHNETSSSDFRGHINTQLKKKHICQ